MWGGVGGKERKEKTNLTPFSRVSVPLLALAGTLWAVRMHIRELTKVLVLYSLTTSGWGPASLLPSPWRWELIQWAAGCVCSYSSISQAAKGPCCDCLGERGEVCTCLFSQHLFNNPCKLLCQQLVVNVTKILHTWGSEGGGG